MLIFCSCNVFLILIAIQRSHSICVGTQSRVCLTELSEEDTNEKLKYALSKYEEAEMKIVGELVNVRGKRISYRNMEEVNISFQYVDNTENDIIQHCVLVLIFPPGQCETVDTICNTFLPRTPRPLLEREPLTICEDGVSNQREQTEIPEPRSEDQHTTTAPETTTLDTP